MVLGVMLREKKGINHHLKALLQNSHCYELRDGELMIILKRKREKSDVAEIFQSMSRVN